jgi:phospholipid transport system substrate-binding protein
MTRWLTVLAAVFVCVSGAVAADDSPNAVIESAVIQFAEQLEGRRDELSENRAELYAIVDSILLPRFDRRFAAQVVLATHWRTASEEQQARFIEAFYRALLRQYSDGILEFDPNKITVLPYRGDPTKRRTKVRSTVLLDDGSKAAVDYDLVKRQAGWLVFNVVIEGVSYVVNYRAELDSEIRASSLDAVIERLEGEAGISTASQIADE